MRFILRKKLKTLLLYFLALCTVLSFSGCFASPTYWAMSKAKRIDILDEDNPEAAKRGWQDGCKAALSMSMLPSMIRGFNEFNIDPYYVNDPLNKDAWGNASSFCQAKVRVAVSKKFLEVYNYMDPRGDSIIYKR